MATTWALCGPLQLSPRLAALTDSAYNGGFMAGRVSGALLAARLRPSTQVQSVPDIERALVSLTSTGGDECGGGSAGCLAAAAGRPGPPGRPLHLHRPLGLLPLLAVRGGLQLGRLPGGCHRQYRSGTLKFIILYCFFLFLLQLFFLGCGAGSLASPPLAGKLFAEAPIYVN